MSSKNTLTNIAGLFLFAVITAVSVLAVDMLVLLLLDLLRNASTLVLLLFFEGLAMMLVSTAGWGVKEHRIFVAGWKRAKIYHVSYSPRYPSFWLIVALAGLMLIFIDLYLVSQYY